MTYNTFLAWSLPIIVILGALAILRVELVYRFRMKVHERVFSHDDWVVLAREDMAVPFNDMVIKFWKPFRSFYSQDFIRKTGM